DSLDSHRLSGTDGAFRPFWSPDSHTIAFFAGDCLKRIDVDGGPATVIVCEGAGLGGTWNQDGTIVFNPGVAKGLFRVSSTGGPSVPVTALDQARGETSHRFPCFLPDGKHVLYQSVTTDPEKRAIYVADLNSKERRMVLPAFSNAAYAPPGFLLFAREQTLMALPFNAATAQTAGDAVPVAEHVDSRSSGYQSFSLFSVSQNGVLVYGTGGASGAIQLTWFDRSGRPSGTV